MGTADLSYHWRGQDTNLAIWGKSDGPEIVRPPWPPRERTVDGGLFYIGSLAVRRIAMKKTRYAGEPLARQSKSAYVRLSSRGHCSRLYASWVVYPRIRVSLKERIANIAPDYSFVQHPKKHLEFLKYPRSHLKCKKLEETPSKSEGVTSGTGRDLGMRVPNL